MPGRPTAHPSPRQRDLLRFIERFTREHGFPPAMTEMRDALGLASNSALETHLLALRRKGLIDRSYATARTTMLTPAGLSAIGVAACAVCGARR